MDVLLMVLKQVPPQTHAVGLASYDVRMLTVCFLLSNLTKTIIL